MTKTRDLANLIADSKVGPSEIDTTGTYNMNALQVGGTTVIDSSRNATFTTVGTPAGTAAAPAYTFSFDTNTGMFKRGTDQIGFSAGGTEILALTSTGIFADKVGSKSTGSDLTLVTSGDIILDANVAVSSDTYLSNASTTGSQITLNSDNTASWLGTRELISFESVGNGADHRTGTLSVKLKKGPSDSALTEFMQINAVSNYTTFTGKLLTTAPSNPELLTNGTFSNGTTGWTAHSSILSVSNGQLSVADNGGYTKAWQAITTVANEAYELTFTGVSVTGQHLVVAVSGTPVNSNTWGDIKSFAYSSSELPVTHSHVFKATTTTTYISVGSEGSNTAVFDNVSIKKVALNDNQVLTQADLVPQLEGLGLKIDAAGRITTQYHPAFTAQPTSFTGSGGIAGTQTFIFATTLLNRGGHFDTSNGRFTAPVDGNYFFTYSITASSNSKNARYFRVRLAKNGTTVINPHNTISDETGNADYNLISASGLVAMQAGDYVSLNYGSSIDASGLVFYNDMNTFSGFLVS